jgi:mycofactocin precursor
MDHDTTAIDERDDSTDGVLATAEAGSTGSDTGLGHESGETALLVEELLVEEISIDGMCGVY